MDTVQAQSSTTGWVKGWMVLRVKEELPGDLVSFHDHAAEAQADAQRRGPGHQVFHGSRKLGSDEFIVD